MLRLVSLLTILFTAALATAAQATPTPSFTVSDSPTVGIPVTFDATGTVCDAEPCGYTWRILDGSRLGITFGRTPVARYTFDEPGLVAVQLRVVNSNPRIGGPSAREASLVQSFTVAPGTAPRCPDASLTTRPGVPVALPADPCSHPAGNPNDAVGAPAPAHGQVVDGSYVPEPGFHGVDELTYQVADRVTGERSNVATVRVLVDTAPVCADLALTVEPGQTLALVGPSGSGKTTLINLIPRFYDVSRGAVRIDGHDVRDVGLQSLRSQMGMVMQETFLFNMSVRENIKYGRQDASEEQMIEAAEQAKVAEVIAGLIDPKGMSGYDAHVGERGVKLSGGQRQRVAIARVLLKDAPILFLDEATSALDSEVEAAIQEQLQSLMKGKTVIAIAHRLSTIAAMDRLVVLEAGRIVEEGNHAALLAKGGHYAQLWERQSGGFLDLDAKAAE